METAPRDQFVQGKDEVLRSALDEMKNIYSNLHEQPDRLRRQSFPSDVNCGGLHDGRCPRTPAPRGHCPTSLSGGSS